jgi:hypothetical protein
MWRSTGFFMNFSVVLLLACVVAYITLLVGGRATREGGWKLLSGLLSAVAAGQIIAMSLVVSYSLFVRFQEKREGRRRRTEYREWVESSCKANGPF